MPRPSDERRAYLRSADQDVSSFPISNFCPIQRYYIAAEKALEAFDEAYSCLNIDKAYSLGRRFATFSAEALPKHDYYRSPKAELVKLRQKNQKDIERVIDLMEKVVVLMDQEEIQKKKKREEEERKERERQEEIRRLQEEKNSCQLSEKLKKLDFLFPKVPTGVGPTQIPPPETPSPFVPESNQTEDKSDNDSTPNTEYNLMTDVGPLPTPMPVMASAPPLTADSAPAPPSYSELMKRKNTAAPNTAFWDVSDDISNQQSHSTTTKPPPVKVDQTIPVRTRRNNSIRDFENLKSKNQIEIFYLSTYQGKITHIPSRDSTNGCAVISPLVAALHLQSDEKGVSNAHIAKVIDEIAPPILLRVRKKLGLGKNAFIIPSDVHDFLVDEKILLQEQFVGVVGGNILDDDHIGELLRLLENGSDEINGESSTNAYAKNSASKHKKVAGALFFHEHVVSIVKTVQSGGSRCYYDLVDSMPDHGTDSATRTRCRDIESFKSALSYYALTKFSPTELGYIDKNTWNADMVDFDPRVFQAFVWKE